MRRIVGLVDRGGDVVRSAGAFVQPQALPPHGGRSGPIPPRLAGPIMSPAAPIRSPAGGEGQIGAWRGSRSVDRGRTAGAALFPQGKPAIRRMPRQPREMLSSPGTAAGQGASAGIPHPRNTVPKRSVTSRLRRRPRGGERRGSIRGRPAVPATRPADGRRNGRDSGFWRPRTGGQPWRCREGLARADRRDAGPSAGAGILVQRCGVSLSNARRW